MTTSSGALAPAVRALEESLCVVYPTDTLLGLGARAEDPRAVARLAALKARPAGQPLSVAVASYEEVEPWADLGPSARAALRRSLPGPYTFLLPASRRARAGLAPETIGPGGTIAVRIPDHWVARALTAACGPIVATSANRHGAPPTRTIPEARALFGRSVGAYVRAGPTPRGAPSEIVDLTGSAPRTVRRG